MEDLVDYIAIAVSFLAILVSLYTFNKTSGFNKYQQVDEIVHEYSKNRNRISII